MESIVLKVSVSAIEAAKAGVDHFGATTVEVQPSKLSDGGREVLGELLKLKSGVDSGSVVYRSGYVHNVPAVPVSPTPESVLQWIEVCAAEISVKQEIRRREAAAKEEADREAVRKWAAKPDEELVRHMGVGAYDVSTPYSYPDDMKDFVVARKAQAQVLADRLNAAAAENVAKAKKRKDEAAARRADQLKDWLTTKGSDSMRKRAARGLLPEEDLIAAIRNEAYAPLDGFTRFERLTDDEVRAFVDAADFDQTVVYESREAESAHEEDIELMERIEALVPGAVCTLMVHEGKLDDDEQDVALTRLSVRVAINVGELQFSREYAAGR